MSGSKSKTPVVTRFPPEPSGYLHIGHLQAIYHNLLTAKRQKGYCILRFDDTNPASSKQHYVDNMLTVLDQYGLLKQFANWEKPSYASDYFSQLLNCMEQLIKQGDAYIDESSSEEIQRLRSTFKPSPYRDTSIDDNLTKWDNFVLGYPPNAVVRLKISYNNPNGSLRDPIAYRNNIVDSHYRTNRDFNVYPTYDFACPIVDSLDGVTLAQRTNEFTDKNDLMKWIFKKLPDLNKMPYKSYSRMVFEYSILSKRKIRELVERKIVDDWDDPRLDTLTAELRKGILPASWENFFTKHGVSNANNVEEWDKMLSINRKIIDNDSKRIMALSQNTWDLIISDLPDEEDNTIKSVCWNPKDKKGVMGNKDIKLSKYLKIDDMDAKLLKQDDIVYLLNFRALTVTNVNVEDKMIEVKCYNEEFKFSDIPYKISWLTKDELELSPVETVYYDYLITKQYLTKDDKFDDHLNPNTMDLLPLYLSHNQSVLEKHMIIQLVRFGYYIVDSIEPLRLIHIREPGNNKQYLLKNRVNF